MHNKREKFENLFEVIWATVNTVYLKICYYGYAKKMRGWYFRTFPDCPKLTKEQKRDYINYYKSFGFRHVWTTWIDYIYAITGDYDKRYFPDDIFTLYVDNPYWVEREAWQNKAFQPAILPDVKFPEIIVKRLNGYYFDKNNEKIDVNKALEIIKEEKEVVIKHVIGGAGTDLAFYETSNVGEKLLADKKYDFIVQKILKQSEELSKFNKSSVNIIKITSFLYKGKVHILSSRLWVGGEGDRLSNSSGGLGYQVVINDDCSLNDTSMNLEGKRINKRADGTLFKYIKLDFYKDCVEIIKKGYEKLLYFPFISWDFTCDENNNPVLIEYNLKWHILWDFQILTGPAFGDLTDEILKDAAEKRKENKSIFLK